MNRLEGTIRGKRRYVVVEGGLVEGGRHGVADVSIALSLSFYPSLL